MKMSSISASSPPSETFSNASSDHARPPKRKVADDGDQPPTSKRATKKMKKSKRSASAAEDSLYPVVGEGQHVNSAIGQMDGCLTADYIGRQIKRFEPDLSSIELEERRIPESAFVDTTSWSKARNLENLPSFINHFAGMTKKSLSKAPAEKNGAPHTIVIAAAGLRAADLTRSLRVFQSNSATVAKLFAKHTKLKDAINSTKRIRMNIGVGTPQRLLDLIQQGALSLDHVERILIDASQVNTKKRGILEMEETEVPLTRLLALEEVKSRYGTQTTEKAIKILLY